MKIGLSKKHWIVGTAAVGLLSVGILAGTASAQTPEAGSTDSATGATAVVETVKDKFFSKVASILGVEEAALESAVKQARQEIADEGLKTRLDAAVTAGTITQAQADEYYNWYQARPDDLPGVLGGPGGRRGPGLGGPGFGGERGFGGRGGHHGMGGPRGMFRMGPPAVAPEAPATPATTGSST